MNFKKGIQTKHTVVIDLIPSILTNIMIIQVLYTLLVTLLCILYESHAPIIVAPCTTSFWYPVIQCLPTVSSICAVSRWMSKKSPCEITDTKKRLIDGLKPQKNTASKNFVGWFFPMFAGWLGLSQMGTAPNIMALLVMMTNHVILVSSYWIWQIPWYSMVNLRRVHAREEYETRMLVRCFSHAFQVSVRIDGYWCIKLINDYQIIPLINDDKTMDCYQIEMADYNILFLIMNGDDGD